MAELIQRGGKILYPTIHKLSSGRRILMYQFTRRLELTAIIIMGYQCYQLHTNFIKLSCLSPYIGKVTVDQQCGTEHNRSNLFAFYRHRRKSGSTVHQLFTDFKKAYDCVMGDVLYNILIEFVIPLIQVRLIKLFK
jgi:hypothetical protein